MPDWNYFNTEDEEKVIENNWVTSYEWIYLPDDEKEEMVDAWYSGNEERLKEVYEKANIKILDGE